MVIYVAVISFRDEESVGNQNCLDKVFVYLIHIGVVGSMGNEILNMLFKRCPIGLLVVCYYFGKVRASCFSLVMHIEGGLTDSAITQVC